MGDIGLSSSVRNNLFALQVTARLLSQTQDRLATGKRVNSPLDNPASFFTASRMNSRAAALNRLLDTMSIGTQTVEAADDGLSAITTLVETARATALEASQAVLTVDGPTTPATVAGTGTLSPVASAPVFTQQTGGSNPFDGIDIGSYSSPTMTDIDGDGDLDLFVGDNSGDLQYFENTGTATNPVYSATSVQNPFGLSDVGSYVAPTFVDLDGDGDLDAFIGDDSGKVEYLENTGTTSSPSFAAKITNPFGFTDVGSYSNPTFVDIDNDGDLDAFVGETDGKMNYFENTGTASSPSFASPVSSPFGINDVGDDSSPAFMDADGDGDLDAFVGEADGKINYFENTGTASSPNFASSTSNPFGLSDVGNESHLAVADVDGDGDMDLVVGEADGNVNYFENTASVLLSQGITAGETLTVTVGGGSAQTITFGTNDGAGEVDTLAELNTAISALTGFSTQSVNLSNGGISLTATSDTDSITIGGTVDVTKFGLAAGVISPVKIGRASCRERV